MNRRRLLVQGTALAAFGATGSGVTAKTSGFYVPAEDTPHQRCFMQWPVTREVYPSRRSQKAIQQTIASIANAISEFEPVTMLAASEHHGEARRRLSSGVELWDIATDDLWCRDSGPIFARNNQGRLAIAHIQFNGWGNKQQHRNDGKIAEKIAQRLGLPLINTGLKGEAGGVEQDGHGTFIAHESSWVLDNRNPGLSRQEIGSRLLAAYGAEKMIWAPGLAGEDITDYHIDGLARFIRPGQVLVNMPEDPDPKDPYYKASVQTIKKLKSEGLKVDVIPEPNDARIRRYDFVASYANFYLANGGVIAAEFGDPRTDEIAKQALADHFPGREVITLNVDRLGKLGGGIHCATQQMPA